MQQGTFTCWLIRVDSDLTIDNELIPVLVPNRYYSLICVLHLIVFKQEIHGRGLPIIELSHYRYIFEGLIHVVSNLKNGYGVILVSVVH